METIRTELASSPDQIELNSTETIPCRHCGGPTVNDLSAATSQQRLALRCVRCDRITATPFDPEFTRRQTHDFDLPVALQNAADILNSSAAPLVVGTANLVMEAQVEAWKLAERLQGTIDVSLDNEGRAGVLSFQRHGKVTATYGELGGRCDLLICWFCDPVESHPCVLDLITRQRAESKTLIVIDERVTRTAAIADQVITASRTDAIAMLSALRGMTAGLDSDTLLRSFSTNQSNDLLALFDQVGNANYGALVFGSTSVLPDFNLETESLMRWTTELNDLTRFVELDLGGPNFNYSGAVATLTGCSGYPFAVDFQRSGPRYWGLEYSAQHRLLRGECDAAVLLGCDLDEMLPPALRRALESIPVISLGPVAPPFADVFLPCLTETDAGMVIRGDGCALHQPATPSTKSLPTATRMLEELGKSLSSIQAVP